MLFCCFSYIYFGTNLSLIYYNITIFCFVLHSFINSSMFYSFHSPFPLSCSAKNHPSPFFLPSLTILSKPKQSAFSALSPIYSPLFFLHHLCPPSLCQVQATFLQRSSLCVSRFVSGNVCVCVSHQLSFIVLVSVTGDKECMKGLYEYEAEREERE